MFRLSRRFVVCLRLAVVLLAIGFWMPAGHGQSSELRAYWVDSFHSGFFSAAEVNTLTNDLRAGHFNAVVVEVRKRGDAYYTPNTAYPDYEPHASNTSPSDFDSLADLIAKCHNTNYGPRIEVHAWLVTFPIWNNQTNHPSNPQHPYNRHPEWLMSDNTGATWESSGKNYMFDPGHPGVQQHTWTIAMNLVTNYDLDGLNFDYVRYPGNTWGYNSVAVSRFRARFGGSGNPAATDADWLQFRRDQVTALVRKIYLSTIAVKPWVKISADTICYAPGITTDAQWPSSSAYDSVLQDWRAWMQEGILDLNLPMMYFDYSVRASDWNNWSIFAKDHRYNRHLAIGPGAYMNSTANAITEMRSIRNLTSAGNRADGVCLFSYAFPNNDSVARADFHNALTTTGASAYDSQSPGMFNQEATVPVMPWKTTPTKAHLKGFVYGGNTSNPLDGAVVTLTGPAARTQTNDATGFYGFVDLPPGTYAVSAGMNGMGRATNSVTITAGIVTTSHLIVPTTDNIPPVISGVGVTNISDSAVTILWNTGEKADSVVEFGATAAYGTSVTNSALTLSHSVALSGLPAGTTFHYRVKSRDAAGNQAVSGDFAFITNPAGIVTDIIIDDSQATVAGSWTTTSSSPGYYGSGYRYKSAGNGASYVEFRPNILTAGSYLAYTWYVQGGNRAADVPYIISGSGGTKTVDINQQINGSQWVLLGTFAFNAGTAGYTRISDAFTSGSVVMADAIKLVYVPPPPSAPLIVAQPQSVTARAWTNVTFSVSATGTAPLSYQWRFNGLNIAGATGTAYTRTNIVGGDAGPYMVAVANAAGTVTSAVAVLTVIPPTAPYLDSVSLFSGGLVQLRISGDAGHYAIDASANLVSWTELTNFITPDPSFLFIDPATNFTQRFYRARIMP